jgi:hypothetical protein
MPKLSCTIELRTRTEHKGFCMHRKRCKAHF